MQLTYVVEKCNATGLYAGYVPGIPGAHSQGETLEELRQNMQEVLALLQEDGALEPESEFICTQQVAIP